MSRLVAADMKVVRMSLGVTRRDKLRNSQLCKELDVSLLSGVIKNTQLRRFGHVRRREDGHRARLVLEYKVEGTRPSERPRKRWHQYVDDFLQEKGTSLREVEEQQLYYDRAAWRSLCVSSTPR